LGNINLRRDVWIQHRRAQKASVSTSVPPLEREEHFIPEFNADFYNRFLVALLNEWRQHRELTDLDTIVTMRLRNGEQSRASVRPRAS